MKFYHLFAEDSGGAGGGRGGAGGPGGGKKPGTKGKPPKGKGIRQKNAPPGTTWVPNRGYVIRGGPPY